MIRGAYKWHVDRRGRWWWKRPSGTNLPVNPWKRNREKPGPERPDFNAFGQRVLANYITWPEHHRFLNGYVAGAPGVTLKWREPT